MPSEKVQKVITVLKHDPQLVREMSQALTKAYNKAGVTLTDAEKAELFESLGSAIKSKTVTGF